MSFTGVTTFDDDAYGDMSFDERRNFNLARNREMMNLLFAGVAGGQEDDDVQKQASVPQSSVCVDVTPNEDDSESLAKLISIDMCCRDREVLELVQFLDMNLFPSHPLVVYGAAAAGKSLLCSKALAHMTSSPHTSVSCSGATSVKQLYQRIWSNSLSSVSKFNKSQLNISSSFEEQTKFKTVTTFNDLADKMASLLFCQAYIFNQVNTKKVPGLVIMIDHVDKADDLEEGLSRRLLALDELCHPMIKVLALCRSFPLSMTSDSMLLHLHPYSDSDLISILCRKRELEIRRLDSSSDTMTPHPVTANFRALCEQTLPQCTLTTRRVDEIWAIVQELYCRRGVAPSMCDMTGKEEVALTTSTSHCGSKRTLEEDVNAIVLCPAVHMAASTSTLQSLPVDIESFFGKRWYVHLPLKAKALSLAAFLASRNPPASDRSTFGNASKGRRKKSRSDGGETPAASKTSTGVQPQSFGVERLLGIYQQIFPSISAATASMPVNKYRKDMTKSVGDTDMRISVFSSKNKKTFQKVKDEGLLYTMVNTLLKKRILMVYAVSSAGTKAVKSSDSNNSLLFLCSLDMSRAEELAQSVAFPLRDFLIC